jgi:hypothetical protein
MSRPFIAGVAFSLIAGPAAAQTDFRNLDGHRPSRVEDAYPIERDAFELSLPYRFESGGGSVHGVTPELAWGAFRNGEVGVALDWEPVRSGLAANAPRLRSQLFGAANLVGEAPGWPALMVRADLAAPLDRGGPGQASLTLGGAATRSWGIVRMHLNGGWTVAAPADPRFQSTSRWWAGVAVDRTWFRTSTLVVAEVVTERPIGSPDLEWTTGLGLRRQMTPSLVLDLGANVRWAATDRVAITFGFSHSFAIAGLMHLVPR